MFDFVRRWGDRTEIATRKFIPWLGVSASKFYDWWQRYGKVNEQNAWVRCDFWLEDLPRLMHRWDKSGCMDTLGGEKEFKRAIELNPTYASARHWYSHDLMAMGRTGESLCERHAPPKLCVD